MDELDLYLDEAKDLMTKTLNHLASELTKIRAGKANPAMLDGIMVSYYGAMTPLNQVASMTTPDTRFATESHSISAKSLVRTGARASSSL